MEQLLTLDEICRLEPGIRDLYDEARLVDTSGDYNDMEKFYGYGAYRGRGIKARLVRLVGWARCRKDVLATVEAYDIAYRTIFDALPMPKGRS